MTFEDVPKGVEFYVLETNANGVLADTGASAKYTCRQRYPLLPPNRQHRSAVQADGKTEITNTEEIDYSITVSKVLIADDVKSTPAFSVGLFTKNGDTYTQIDAKTVSAGSSVTFDGLDADTEYYIFEMNGKERVGAGKSFVQSLSLTDFKDPTTKTDKTFYVSYNGCDDKQAILLTKDAPSADAVITNATENPTRIKVTKIATEDGKPAVDHAIQVGLYTQNADEQLSAG